MKKLSLLIVAACVCVVTGSVLWRNASTERNENSATRPSFFSEDSGQTPYATEAGRSDESAKAMTSPTAKSADKLLGTYAVPQGNAVEIFNRLKVRADQGDGFASFGIYQKLRECNHLPSRALDDELAAAYEKAGRGDAFFTDLQEQLRDCEGAAKLLEVEKPGLWLERAADQGALIAQLIYAADQRSVLGTPQDMIKNPENLIRYKKRALGFLHAAASKGSSDAMFKLADAYTNNFFAEKSPERAYAYAYAAALRSSDPAANQLRDLYATNLDSGQIARARTEAQRIFDACCK